MMIVRIIKIMPHISPYKNFQLLLKPKWLKSCKSISSCTDDFRTVFIDYGDVHEKSIINAKIKRKTKCCQQGPVLSLHTQFDNMCLQIHQKFHGRKSYLHDQKSLHCSHSSPVLLPSGTVMTLSPLPIANVLSSVPCVGHIQQNRGIWDIFKKANFGSYTVLDRVGEVSTAQQVPAHITCPLYAQTGDPPLSPSSPEVKADWQVQAMRDSCYLARSVLNIVGENIQVGITTEDIDKLVHNKIIENGAYPSPLNYLGFPKSVCTSVNNVACHGIPDDRQLVDGDIISVDVTVFYNGYHGDCCETYIVGNVDKAGQRLVEAARQCRDATIEICAPGVPFTAIGAKVQEVADQLGVTVVPCFIGHGIGEYFHGPPDIYHCYNTYPGCMEAGMTFTVEPIIAQGKEDVLILEDGWTAVMLDNGRAAQFEHTVLITEDGYEILTDYY